VGASAAAAESERSTVVSSRLRASAMSATATASEAVLVMEAPLDAASSAATSSETVRATCWGRLMVKATILASPFGVPPAAVILTW
jgi:hypothetical protein